MRTAVGLAPGTGDSRRRYARDGELRGALRGYSRRQVNALLARCSATLRADPLPSPAALTADDVREARFTIVFGGYHLADVDAELRRLLPLLPAGESWVADPEPPADGPGLQLRTTRRGYARPDVDAFLLRCAHSLRDRVAEVPELAPLTGKPRSGRPLRVRDVEVVEFPLVRGGYAPDGVDALLDRVRAVLARR